MSERRTERAHERREERVHPRGACARLAVRSLVLVLGVAAVMGCLEGPASSPPLPPGKSSTPVAVFPPQADLANLPSLPAPAEAFPAETLPVDRWAVEAPAADQDDPSAYPRTSPWDELARAVASRHEGSVRLSPALRCAADEVARFHVEKRAAPTESLRRFIVARCGGSSPDAATIGYTGEAGVRVAEANLYEQGRPRLEGVIEPHVGGDGHFAIGIGAYRAGERYAVIAFVGSDEFAVESASHGPVDESRRVIVRGSVRRPAADAVALINRGDYGVARCPRDPRVALPSVAFSCRLGEGDKVAWVQIAVRREGRFLTDPVADLLAYEGDLSKIEYQPRPSGARTPVSDAAGFTSSLLAAINRKRAEGHLSAASLAVKQSAENARLAGTLVDANQKGKNDVSDSIALGLVAGWDVDGTIRGGQLLVAAVTPTHDADAWLDFALERPLGRSVLLDPEARSLAIGPAAVEADAPGLAAVVTSYALFDSSDHARDSSALADRVAARRSEVGKAPLAKLPLTGRLAEEAKLVLAGALEPSDALNLAMRSVAQRVTGTVHGFLVETNDLEHAPIPDRLLRAPKGLFAVEVTHHRVKGAAWGQYVVLYLLVVESRGDTIDL